jgi:H/ACA ribonucleoprotein complex subunit 2
MGKEKKEKKDKTPSKAKEDSDGGDGELRPVCAIAKPLADIGFHKKILKVVKKGAAPPVPGRKTRPSRGAIDRQSLAADSRHRPATALTTPPRPRVPAASKHKQVKRGVKEVVKALRKDVKGCVLASRAPALPQFSSLPDNDRPPRALAADASSPR